MSKDFMERGTVFFENKRLRADKAALQARNTKLNHLEGISQTRLYRFIKWVGFFK